MHHLQIKTCFERMEKHIMHLEVVIMFDINDMIFLQILEDLVLVE